MPTLGYWNIRGLAQPIRLLLNFNGEEFEDVRYQQGPAPDYSRDTWSADKEVLGLDFPNLPYYIDGDIKITQSNAILRYIGRKYNMVGETDAEKVKVDMLLDQIMDIRNGAVRLFYGQNFEEDKGPYLKGLSAKLSALEKFIGNNEWLVGSKLTVPDFHLYEMLDQHFVLQDNCLDDFPNLRAFKKRFEELPAIKKYMASDKFLKRPINNTQAKFSP